jgi:hypothetical protein
MEFMHVLLQRPVWMTLNGGALILSRYTLLLRPIVELYSSVFPNCVTLKNEELDIPVLNSRPAFLIHLRPSPFHISAQYLSNKSLHRQVWGCSALHSRRASQSDVDHAFARPSLASPELCQIPLVLTEHWFWALRCRDK